jgi:hypothetical protein
MEGTAMNSKTLQAWLQIIGLIVVVSSLIFVGLQLKQSHEIAIAAQYQARLDSASSHYIAIINSDAGLNVIGKDILADMLTAEDLAPEIKAWAQNQPVAELGFRFIGATLFLKSHDNIYFQYQAGFLSDEAWAALREQFKAGLNDPRTWTKGVFEESPKIWRESYRELIYELISEAN